MLAGGNGTEEDRRAFKARVEWGREVVFGDRDAAASSPTSTNADANANANGDTQKKKKKRRPILLSESVLDKFSLGKLTYNPTSMPLLSPPLGFTNPPFASNESCESSEETAPSTSPDSKTPRRASTGVPTRYRPNSHLALLAMVDSWAHLKINPYTHLSLAATPLFRLFLGVAEHLFLNPSLLRASLHSALYDTWHRADDLEFVVAARGWSQAVGFGNFEVYKRRFMQTRAFLESRFEEGVKVGSEMIKAVMETEVQREKEEEKEEGEGVQ